MSTSIWSHSIDLVPKDIGRQSACAIQLLHESVSRRHAEVWQVEDQMFIRDLGSSNGTFVNRQRVTESRVIVGDSLMLGKVLLDVVQDRSLRSSQDITNQTTAFEHPVSGTETLDLSVTSLSEAQLRVLRLLLTGLSEKEVADVLYLSPHTVHSHVRQIYQFYDVNSRPALMAHFIDLALLNENPDTTAS
ncbi:MAG: FHA domain-containing protein [Planctomycetaceae bacterium]